MENKNIWNKYTTEQEQEIVEVNETYKEFLNRGKTERECVASAVRMAEEKGYRNLDEIIASGEGLKAGDRVYAVNMKKSIALFQIGEKPMEEGMNILGAHVDSPRLDIKQNPLYEDTGLAYLDTHYYGGIKKYQWVASPMSLHGVVVKKDGTVIDVVIGEEESDPVFCITDLLVHLAGEQMNKKASVVIAGEDLNLLVGSRPVKKEEAKDTADCGGEKDEEDKKEKEPVKAMVLALLKEKYDMEEEDFLSAELEVVPAGKARDCGIDRSMVLSYGQDDRICAYTSLEAILQMETVGRTACCLLVDKEEIGSVGATGMTSRFFENTVAEILDRMGQYSDLALRRCLSRSRMLSSDVSAGFDPIYAQAFEKKNAAYLGRGMSFNKFTGSRGKGGSNDANAEYIARLRRIFDEAGVSFQTAELGKVDVGGGGTIAYILAEYGMQVIDSGLPVLNMHALYELSSKADVYEAIRGYKAFLADDTQ
ncbi:MAG: aminopeptidase [Lachnospiraceae bacterium]|jgi:aspartyl aminopeptidase|nr:aminopeptidase [Lachnospiraceae bacterium]